MSKWQSQEANPKRSSWPRHTSTCCGKPPPNDLGDLLRLENGILWAEILNYRFEIKKLKSERSRPCSTSPRRGKCWRGSSDFSSHGLNWKHSYFGVHQGCVARSQTLFQILTFPCDSSKLGAVSLIKTLVFQETYQTQDRCAGTASNSHTSCQWVFQRAHVYVRTEWPKNLEDKNNQSR